MRAKAIENAAAGVKTYKKIVLAGNPNAGKTTLFNALTHSNLRTGNFPGVTCSPASKRALGAIFYDVPGMYSFSPYSMEEQSAIDEISGADLIINVVDALTLTSGLILTRALVSTGKKVVVYLTKTSLLRRRGGKVDCERLAASLGVPVLDCPPSKLRKLIKSGEIYSFPAPERDFSPIDNAYSAGSLRLSKADKLFYNRFFALAFFVLSVTLMFFLAFHPSMPGAYFKGLTEELICVKLCALVTKNLTSVALVSLISEGILGAAGSVLSFIPQLLVLYLVLTLLDESGICAALAFATDGVFEKAKLSGRAAFSLVSGFGCTAAAILTTRGYSTTGAQKRTVAILPFVPCGAKLPVFLTFLSPLFENPFPVITLFYFSGVAVALIVSFIIKGGGESLLSEVTPIIVPQLKAVAIKLFFYVKGFIIKVSGTILLFCVLSWTLSHYSFSFEYVGAEESMLSYISRALLPLFKPMGVNDWRLAYAALCGFAAKENVAATVALLMPAGANLNLSAALSMCTFMLLCPACVSAFSASVKETGLRFTLKCVAFQLILAFAGAYLIHFLFCL